MITFFVLTIPWGEIRLSLRVLHGVHGMIQGWVADRLTPLKKPIAQVPPNRFASLNSASIHHEPNPSRALIH